MPYCPYCGKCPYATYCKSFFTHVDICQTHFEVINGKTDAKRIHESKLKLERMREKELEDQMEIERIRRMKENEKKNQMEIERIRRMKENEKKNQMEIETIKERLRISENKPHVVVNNTYIQNLVIGSQNLYLDYPKNEQTQQVIQQASTFDVKTIKSVDDLNQIVGYVQDMNNKEIERCLSGQDKVAHSEALSFLADFVRIIRTRLQQETPFQSVVIEAAEEFEKECIDDKKKLIPTVENV